MNINDVEIMLVPENSVADLISRSDKLGISCYDIGRVVQAGSAERVRYIS